MVQDEQSIASASEQPGRLRRIVRALGRHRLLTAAVAVVVVAGGVTAALVLPGGYGETVSGPFGPYPAPLAATGQPHIVAHFYGVVRLEGGLAIVGDGNHVRTPSGSATTEVTDGIAAVSLRTGRLYWSYERPGHDVVSVTAAPNGLNVLWEDGLLVRIDPRSAVIAWHHDVGATAGQVWAAEKPGSQGTALVISNSEIAAVSESTGSPLWSRQIGAPCQFYGPALTTDVVVVGLHAADDGSSCAHRLQGYDLSTGQLRWQEPYPGWLQAPVAAGPDTVVGGTSELATYEVINASSGRQERTIAALRGPSTYDGDDLLLVGDSSSAGDSSDLFGAWDTATGQLLWQHSVPGGESLNAGPFLASSSQADVITDSAGPPIPDGVGDGQTLPSTQLWLYGYDARTGRLLSRTALPVLNVAGGNAYDYAHDMQMGALAVPTASSGSELAITEMSVYESGVMNAGGSPAGLPTLVLSR